MSTQTTTANPTPCQSSSSGLPEKSRPATKRRSCPIRPRILVTLNEHGAVVDSIVIAENPEAEAVARRFLIRVRRVGR